MNEPKTKDTNPKDAIGSLKLAMSTVPAQVMAELGLALLEGAIKYRRHNYRIAGVRASVYYDATLRHLFAWWEGEDIDEDSGLSHVTKAMASLTVLRDAMFQDMLTDDRPPPVKDTGWVRKFNDLAKKVLGKYEIHLPPFTRDDETPYRKKAA